ncbi:unnamed protein product [Sphagnum jensenii]|uniref:Uncharacterized protein n=1 Tax=Sphagnum jensenii TaxID=128206 RepID=A0ABP0XCV5_9BRYO
MQSSSCDCLEQNCESKLIAAPRQVGELQGVVEELKSEACAKEVDLNLTAQVAVVEEEQRQNARLIADLKLELQQVK